MDNEKTKNIRNARRAFVQKTMEGAMRILVKQTADHVEDSSREKLMGLKFTMNKRLETIKKLDETILENTKKKDIEKQVDDSAEVCANVYHILAKIDLSLEDAKVLDMCKLHQALFKVQCNNNVKSNEGAKVKLPKLEVK